MRTSPERASRSSSPWSADSSSCVRAKVDTPRSSSSLPRTAPDAPACEAPRADAAGDPERDRRAVVDVLLDRNQPLLGDQRALGEHAVARNARAVAEEPGARPVLPLDDRLAAGDVRQLRVPT